MRDSASCKFVTKNRRIWCHSDVIFGRPIRAPSTFADHNVSNLCLESSRKFQVTIFAIFQDISREKNGGVSSHSYVARVNIDPCKFAKPFYSRTEFLLLSNYVQLQWVGIAQSKLLNALFQLAVNGVSHSPWFKAQSEKSFKNLFAVIDWKYICLWVRSYFNKAANKVSQTASNNSSSENDIIGKLLHWATLN